MSTAKPNSIDAIDLLCQVRDELNVVWLALGNTSDLSDDGLLTQIREHVNGLHNRVSDICQMMEGGA